MFRRAAFASLAVLALSACASGQYPSLARRGAERVAGTAPAVSPAPSPTPEAVLPTAGLSARLAGLVAQAREAHRRFTANRAGAEGTIGRAGGAAMGSESWSLASVALAGLEASRSNAMVALAELDSLYVADRVAHYDSPSGDVEAIAAARDQVSGWVAEQDRVLSALRGRIRG